MEIQAHTSRTATLRDVYKKVSDRLREEFRFGIVTEPEVLKHAGHADSAAVVVFTHEKRSETKTYTGAADRTALTEWLYANSLPLAGEFNSNTESRYKRRGVPILKLFIDVDFKVNVKQTNYWLNRLRKVASENEAFQNKLSFTIVDK